MEKEVIARSIDGVISEIIRHEKYLRELWRIHKLPQYYKTTERRFSLYAKAVLLIRRIRKLRLIVRDLHYLMYMH